MFVLACLNTPATMFLGFLPIGVQAGSAEDRVERQLSFFEYLGTAVVEGNEIIDPLTLHEENVGDAEDAKSTSVCKQTSQAEQVDVDACREAEQNLRDEDAVEVGP